MSVADSVFAVPFRGQQETTAPVPTDDHAWQQHDRQRRVNSNDVGSSMLAAGHTRRYESTTSQERGVPIASALDTQQYEPSSFSGSSNIGAGSVEAGRPGWWLLLCLAAVLHTLPELSDKVGNSAGARVAPAASMRHDGTQHSDVAVLDQLHCIQSWEPPPSCVRISPS
jgi:hypothetical protein